MKKQILQPITGYENYKVSCNGEVINSHGRLLKASLSSKGYKEVVLYNVGDRTKFKVHRLVAITFIPNPENKPQVNHINGDKADNRVENLEWATNSENIQHAYDNALNVMKTGGQHPRSKSVKQEAIGGHFVKIWGSIREIERELNYSSSNISKCCKGIYSTAYGFKWSYI